MTGPLNLPIIIFIHYATSQSQFNISTALVCNPMY